MVTISGTVSYKDGTTETYSAGGAVIVEWEIWAARHGYPLTPKPETLEAFPVKTWQLYLAYVALEASEGFDVWRKRVLDVDSDDEPETVNPTQPAVTAAP